MKAIFAMIGVLIFSMQAQADVVVSVELRDILGRVDEQLLLDYTAAAIQTTLLSENCAQSTDLAIVPSQNSNYKILGTSKCDKNETWLGSTQKEDDLIISLKFENILQSYSMGYFIRLRKGFPLQRDAAVVSPQGLNLTIRK
jgi:hypothetical protein